MDNIKTVSSRSVVVVLLAGIGQADISPLSCATQSGGVHSGCYLPIGDRVDGRQMYVR